MRVALDIETSMDHNTIHLCVTQNIDTHEVRVWRKPDGLWEYLKEASLIVSHNGIGFDFPVLNRVWGTKIGPKQAYDTLVVSRLLEPTREQGHSLDAWGKELGVAKLDYKATWQWMMNRREEYDGESFDRPIDGLLDYYCQRDVAVLCLLYRKLADTVNSLEFSSDSVTLEHQVAAIIAKQERNGFKLDVVHATCLLSDLKLKMGVIYDKMQELYPPYEVERFSEKTGKQLKSEIVTFNPASRQQIAEKLIGLGWKPEKKTEKGSVIVDESTLMGLKYPIAQMLAEYMMLQKRIAQIESWLEVVGSDGRVHGRVITNGAVTGRATHMKPNMAQIPNSSSPYGPECRQCWTVEEGNVLVGADASGLELRMLAHYMKDEKMGRTSTRLTKKQPDYRHAIKRRRLFTAGCMGLAQQRLARLSVVVLRMDKGSSMPFLKGLPHSSVYVIKYPYMRPRAMYRGLMAVRFGFVVNMRHSIACFKGQVRL
jgi:DNA polymerase I-like protein with 3'-5' exonuclease and polymerase domains